MARYGGLRCPTEILALSWDDIDWERARMIVKSSKTEHHEGKAQREVPIFPELQPYLKAVQRQTGNLGRFLITRYRENNANLRTHLQRIIKRAGLQVWPKLFQNLRASRATELANQYPPHVAAAWIGHSTAIANKHDWQVTDDDYERAVQGDAESDANLTQNATQPETAVNRDEEKSSSESAAGQKLVPNNATRNSLPQIDLVGDTGFEPVTSTV